MTMKKPTLTEHHRFVIICLVLIIQGVLTFTGHQRIDNDVTKLISSSIPTYCAQQTSK